jgi:IclR helix-turn-helix domain
MGFWAKSLRIFKCLCDNGRQGVRRIAQQTGLSKSSVHRLKQAMERQGVHPESWLWEIEEGRPWLTRLVVATIYMFGLKRGVGLETLSEFFARLHLDRPLNYRYSLSKGYTQGVISSCRISHELLSLYLGH